MMNKTLFVQTYGCQMNVRDSEEVTGLLLQQGYALTDQQEEADVILFNTCSVRGQAENRVWSNVGRLKELKARRPELILGVMGCMAKAHRETIFKRMPYVDFISGPAQLYEVPELISSIQQERRPMAPPPAGLLEGSLSPIRPWRIAAGGGVAAIQEKQRPQFQHVAYHAQGVSALVTVMEGCSKVCSYCIIPYTRGPEVSRPPEQILKEVQRLADTGYREVMLLGQNVNSYGKGLTPSITFAQLLRQVDRVPGIERIRFTTSHPWDAVEELFEAMRDLDHLCEHLHLPVQSGSDKILSRMRRGYTAVEYLEKLVLLRRRVPGVAVSTDVIVGFPGETEEDFEATLELMREAQFDLAYMFKYSPRPFAASSRFEDDVPRGVKDRRLQQLMALQEEIAHRKDQVHQGQVVEVLVEKPGMGRTRTNRKTYFPKDGISAGELVRVRVDRIRGHSLVGEVVA